ncbi:AzlC family ABC transporter permease [Pseudaminobacter sp. NGMCC 1.201702]|uniref:AzlC family ABC transporter permease n=1 Tax=Pseudaminobacter sp. NGMCC 1.201702 TaxID=3391825 RepID=UPI0039F07EEA
MSVEAISESGKTSEFWRGARIALPVVVALFPFGILYGALALENGFTVFEALLMSVTIFAGASQMVGIELFGQQLPPWLIAFSIFAVNFRHILYSAAIGPRIRHWSFVQKAVGFFFLSDPQIAEAETKAERGEEVTFAWYMGIGVAIYVGWVIESALGAMFGQLLPDTHALGLDFLLAIYFLGLVMGFRKRPLWLPIVVASSIGSIVAYKFVGSPWHVSIGAMVGILLAVAMPPKKAEGSDRP